MNLLNKDTRFKYSSLETLSPCGPQCVYLMSEDSNNTVSNSFLLDNYSSIPFSIEDLSKSMNQIDIADIYCRELVQYTGLAWEEFKHIRHAIEFLVIHQKTMKKLDEIINDLCLVHRIQQHYRINRVYWDDRHGTQSVSLDASHNFCP
ncbi:myosin-14-like isoform X2 [Solanum lycopersicum]|uniref:myosin-14-like isoform X2 n=1 Tax=Solanum lycopersicum TaxID=4081 RepID=UPI003747C42F